MLVILTKIDILVGNGKSGMAYVFLNVEFYFCGDLRGELCHIYLAIVIITTQSVGRKRIATWLS